MSEAVEVVNALPGGYALHEYRIESVLGTGGFGLTYLATDTNLNVKVALKEYLPSDFASRNEDSTVQPKSVATAESFQWGLQRFLDEARTLASFRHPNIVRVMRFFEANRTGYMVMELVEGKPLPEWIAPRRPLPQQALLNIVGPLLDGLEVVHKAGYLHRDIKPANVLMREDGSPVLLDFGSARQLMQGSGELTAVVTPGYAPLEQYHAHGNQGPWSDLYAFGGVMYWMVTGAKPVEAAARVKHDILSPAAKTANSSIYSAEVLAAIDWALKPNEDERPRSVAEFRRALSGGQAAVTVVAPTVRLDAASAPTQLVRQDSIAEATGVVLDRELLKRIETDLAKPLGPDASAVVNRAAAKARDETGLYLLIADEIKQLAERKAREEAEEAARARAEAGSMAEAERKIREEVEARAKAQIMELQELARRAREEAEAKAEAARKAREEAELAARARVEAEAKAEAERKAHEEAERKAREEAEAKAKVELKARAEAEALANAQVKELQDQARRAREEAHVLAEAERKAREEAEQAARARAEAEAIAESQRKAREEAERKAREEAEQAARARTEAEVIVEAEERKKREEKARAAAVVKWLKIAGIGVVVLVVAVIGRCT